jgi:hypothetical protein
MHASTGSITPTTYLTILPRSLEQIQLPRRQPTTRKAARSHKLRIVTSPVAPAFRPSPQTKKTIRPKQEQPPSPAMSGYSVGSCPSLSTSNFSHLTVLFLRPEHIWLHCTIPSRSASVHTITDQHILRPVSMLPTTALPSHSRLLCPASCSSDRLPTTSNHWIRNRSLANTK